MRRSTSACRTCRQGKNEKAVEAYDVVIRTYPDGNVVPDAYYKKGTALKNLKQLDAARDRVRVRGQEFRRQPAAVLANSAPVTAERSAGDAAADRRCAVRLQADRDEGG